MPTPKHIPWEPISYKGVIVGNGTRFAQKIVDGHDELLEALKTLAEAAPCKNGCDPSDMTCATMKALAVIAKTEGKATP